MTRRGQIVAATAAVVVLAAGALVAVLATGSGGSHAPLAFTGSVAPARTIFPAPQAGSTVFAREDGSDVLALGVRPGAQGALALQASDVNENGAGVTGLHVSFSVRADGAEHPATASACGTGCYRASVTVPATPTRIRVVVQRPARTTTWDVSLARPWPATDATALIARAARVWRGLSNLRYDESLASDTTDALVSHWQETAPNRLAYQIVGGSSAVIVGDHRWDKGSPTAAWQESASTPVRQPIPFWVSATDAHVIGTATIAGVAVSRISFYDPRTPGWFIASVDPVTGHTLDLRMFATAHFMHDRYGSFDVPNKIVAPASH